MILFCSFKCCLQYFSIGYRLLQFMCGIWWI